MLKTFSFNTSDHPLLFWSDLHLGHDRDFIYTKRGMSNVVEHDKYIIDTLTQLSTKNTILFLLGDTMFGEKGYNRMIDLFDTIPFRKLFMMPGNHHAGFKQVYSKAYQTMSGCSEKDVQWNVWPLTLHTSEYKSVVFLPNYFEIYVDKHPVVLSHYPVRCWNGYAKGAYMLHGHTHGSYYPSTLDSTENGKSIDLGIENCPLPLSWDQVNAYMNQRSVHVEDHHDSSTQQPFG